MWTCFILYHIHYVKSPSRGKSPGSIGDGSSRRGHRYHRVLRLVGIPPEIKASRHTTSICIKIVKHLPDGENVEVVAEHSRYEAAQTDQILSTTTTHRAYETMLKHSCVRQDNVTTHAHRT